MVEMAGLERLLQEHPFSAGFDAKALELLAGCAANERFDAGTYLFREGGAADKFFLLRQGRVALELRVPGRDLIILETLDEGDIIGWAWIVPPYRRVFDARAVERVRAVSIDAKCLRTKFETDHSLGYEFYRRVVPLIAERLAHLRLRLVDMYDPSKSSR